jgi:hypothetical protein
MNRPASVVGLPAPVGSFLVLSEPIETLLQARIRRRDSGLLQSKRADERLNPRSSLCLENASFCETAAIQKRLWHRQCGSVRPTRGRTRVSSRPTAFRKPCRSTRDERIGEQPTCPAIPGSFPATFPNRDRRARPRPPFARAWRYCRAPYARRRTFLFSPSAVRRAERPIP